MKQTTFLGVDPSLTKLGWAIINQNNVVLHCGTIKSQDRDQWGAPLSHIKKTLSTIKQLHETLDDLNITVDFVAVEVPIDRKENSVTAFSNLVGFWAIAGSVVTTMSPAKPMFYSPSVWKQGSVSKKDKNAQTRDILSNACNRLIESKVRTKGTHAWATKPYDDIYDAVGVAMYDKLRRFK